ncbi:MAG TPA: thioesterase family protein [Steroidobacteraceae bacterium]|nr:thioesterase family protein [Steroidobacteraceae bacterium]
MAGTTIYRTAVLPEWIDFNGHLRDAYYVLVLSLATDALMDRLGLDAAYRARTRCTLYSLEMHMHWLHEVTDTDTLEVDAHLLATDAKRLHVGFDVRVIRRPEVVATGEFVLLHVRQGETPGVAPFPPAVEREIAAFKAASGPAPWAGPGSRALSLGRR